MTDFGLSSGFQGLNVCVVVGYAPNKRNGEERKRFWNDMVRTEDRVGNEYRLCVLGVLNGWIGDRVFLEFQ